jgi:hypothetical protein
MLTVGSQGAYQWLVTDQQFDLLRVCPEFVLGKHVAITSIDSGVLVPSDKDKAAGWQSRGKIAYSPRVLRVDELPRAGWDEWYVFDNPTDLGTSRLEENVFEVPELEGSISVFVNYCFGLHLPEMEPLVTLFWQQLVRIRPESYMADNDYLNLVTVNKAVFARVHDAVKALS